MESALLYLAALAIAVTGILRGSRKGLSRQSSDVLGFSFGIVIARVTEPESTDCARLILDTVAGDFSASFVWSVVGTSAVFIVVYLAVSSFTRLLDRVLGNISGGMLDKIFGASFGLLNYLTMLSIAMNLFLAFRPDSEIKDCAAHGDGNLMEGILLISPSLLGSEDVEDLYHAWRMKEAKTIS